MAVLSVERINYVVAGNQNSIINFDMGRIDTSQNPQSTTISKKMKNVSYFADMPADENLSSVTRTHWIRKLYEGRDNKRDNQLSGNTIHDLFDAKDVLYGTNDPKHIIRDDDTVETRGDDESRSRMINTRDMQEVYSPKIERDFLGFVQLYDSFFGMTDWMPQDFFSIVTTQRDDRLHRLSNDSGKMFWNFKLSSCILDSFTYAPLSDLRFNSHDYGQENYNPYSEKYAVSLSAGGYYGWAKSYEQLSSARLTSIFESKFDLVNISANLMFDGKIDYPGTEVRYPDYMHGVIDTTMYIGKNPYNSKYAMEMPTQKTVRGARKYIGVGITGARKPFLKYYDAVNYLMKEGDGEKTEDYPLPALSCDAVQTLDMEEQSPRMDDTDKELPYQSVEIFDSNNRGLNSAKHKSNLYSINLTHTYINSTNIEDKDLLEKIRTDIRNSVRKIAERLEPAHTQLFKVYFNDPGGAPSVDDEEATLESIEISRDSQAKG